MSSNTESAVRPQDIVKVRRDVLAGYMTCRLCKNLLHDATTICECSHTFCKKCILEKLCDDELECCPICNIYLGADPVEKLRTDHILNDVRAKIFPIKRQKINVPEVAPTLTLPVGRKERLLSSIVVNTPRVSSNSTRKRTKVMRLSPLINENVKKEEKIHVENSSSIQTLSKSTQKKRKKLSNTAPSNCNPNKELENGTESFRDKSEIWKPLSCLVEAANRTKGLKPGPSSPGIKPDQSNIHDDDNNNMKQAISMIQDDSNNKRAITMTQNDNNSNMVNTGSRLMTPNIRRRRRRRQRDIGTSTTQTLIDFARSTATHERRVGPIWISIVPSFDQEKDATLLQHPPCYLRLKDGNLPVSFIQKYLVKKLNISNETEQQVEIECQGQPVNPILPIHSLADIWLQHRPAQRAHASIGASAKDFVMVLSYKCKPHAP